MKKAEENEEKYNLKAPSCKIRLKMTVSKKRKYV